MKTLTKIILITIILTSCSENKVQKITVITGELPEQVSKNVQIELNDSIFSSTIDNSGKFLLAIPLVKSQYLYVKGLERKLFLLPNDSLTIKKADDDYLFLGGQSAQINNYYTDWKTYLHSVADTSNSEKYYNQKPLDFLKSVDKWIEIWKKPLYELQKSNPALNEDFIAIEKERIKYWMYGDLNDYENKNHQVPDDFYKYLDKVNLNDINLMQLDEYKYFLISFVFMKTRRLEINDKIQETSKMLDIIQDYFKHVTIKNEISKEIMRLQTSKLCVNDTLIERFKTICTDIQNIREIENDYQNLKPLLKGNRALDFEFIGINGEKVSLNDFKGKYVLIDVWSTTCAPCIKEIPHIEKMKQQYKGKNIEIIAACLSDETAWKSALVKHGLKKGQFRIENGWNSEFRNNYLKTSGVPVYILIDNGGLIIDARAPKPSENLNDLINSLKI